MKKILLFAALLFSITIAAHAQTAWINHPLDNIVSAKFPSEPKEIAAGNVVATEKDTSVVYVAGVVNMQTVANMDSATLAKQKTTPEFVGQLKSGIQSTLPGLQLADFVIGTWNGYTSYTTSGTDTKKRQFDIFLFVKGTKLYSFSTVTKNGTGRAGHDKFMASITVAHK